MHQLARSQEVLGEVQAALKHYQNALDHCPDSEEAQSEKAAIIHNLAIVKANQGQVTEAIALYQQSLELKESIGNVQGKAATLHEIARIKANQGQVTEAIALYQQSLELNEQIGDVQGKAATLHCIAMIKANQGQVTEAIALYQQSIDIERQIGHLAGLPPTLEQLAMLLITQNGDFQTAIEYLEEALSIRRQLNSPDADSIEQLLGQIKQMM